jgi:hypothetical protein
MGLTLTFNEIISVFTKQPQLLLLGMVLQVRHGIASGAVPCRTARSGDPAGRSWYSRVQHGVLSHCI